MPNAREFHFLRDHLKFKMKTHVLEKMSFGNKSTHWVYICKKLEGADQKCEENWESVVAFIKSEMEKDKDYSQDS